MLKAKPKNSVDDLQLYGKIFELLGKNIFLNIFRPDGGREN